MTKRIFKASKDKKQQQKKCGGANLVKDVPIYELLPPRPLFQLGGQGLLASELGGKSVLVFHVVLVPVQDRTVLLVILLEQHSCKPNTSGSKICYEYQI